MNILNTLRLWLGRVLGITAAFLAVYVAYAHVASIATAAEYDSRTFAEDFSSSVDFGRRFTPRSVGSLVHDVSTGVLRIAGSSGEKRLETIEFVGPVRRLSEATLRMRARLPEDGSFELTLGVERPQLDEPAALHVTATRREGVATFRLVGEVGARGRRASGDRELVRASRVDAGPADAWHTVELRFSPEVGHVVLTVDGLPVASHRCDWPEGTDVRMVFGVAAKVAGTRIAAEIAEVAYQPALHDTRGLDFVEHFNGRFVDPRRWVVVRTLPQVATTTFTLTPDGLHTTASATGVTGIAPVLSLVSPTMALGSFRASMNLDVRRLNQGTVFMAIGNPVLPGAKRLLFGISGDRVNLRTFAFGGWEGNGQATFLPLVPWTNESRQLTLEYDATTRRVRGYVDNERHFDARLDLEPTEHVAFSIGTELTSSDASFDILVRKVEFQRLGVAWE